MTLLADAESESAMADVAVGLLAQPALHIHWMPGISLVIGLHFLPMANSLSMPSYWGCGTAMIGGAATIALVVRSNVGSPERYVASEALVNAAIPASVETLQSRS